MIVVNVILLAILPLIVGATERNIPNSSQDKIIASHIYDDDDLKEIQKRLGELYKENKNLAHKVDSLNIMLNQQYTIQRSELNYLEDIKMTLKTVVSQIDTLKSSESRTILDKIQQSELKNDLDDIKSTLKIVLFEITSENQAQNKLKNKLEELQSIWENDLTQIKSNSKSLDFRKTQDKVQQKYLIEIEPTVKTELSQIISDNFYNSTNSSQKIDQTASSTIKQSLPTNCEEALQKGGESAVYKIKIPNSDLEAFDVYCLLDVANDEINSTDNATAWMVIQRREDGSVDFYRNWTDYQQGFGNLEGEFFIGLDKLYALTQSTSHELWIQMESRNGTKFWAKYDRFAIAGASDAYALNVLGTYTGNYDDNLTYHKGMKWTTKDVDNDKDGERNCAVDYLGAWWHKHCYYSNLNALFNGGVLNSISWGAYYLKYVQMAIRPAA